MDNSTKLTEIEEENLITKATVDVQPDFSMTNTPLSRAGKELLDGNSTPEESFSIEDNTSEHRAEGAYDLSQHDNFTQDQESELWGTRDKTTKPRRQKKSVMKANRAGKKVKKLTLSSDDMPGSEKYGVGLSGHDLYGETRRERKAAIKCKHSDMTKHDRLPPPIYKNRVFCCLTTIIILVVFLVCALLGVTVYAYNTYAQPVTEMSLLEALNIAARLRNADESEIVTNPYDSEVDGVKFYEGLSESFKVDTVLTINDLVGGLELMGGDGIVIEDGSTGNPFIDDLLLETEFDFSSLANFDGTEKPSFAISDKMLAAVLNDIFSVSGDIEQLAPIEESLGMPLSELFEVNQVIITPNGDTLETANFKVTLSADLAMLAMSAISEVENVPAFISSMIPVLLPDKLFFSFALTPGTEETPELHLNNLNKKMMSQLIVTTNNLLALKNESTGEDSSFDFNAMLDTIGDEVNKLFQKVNTAVGEGGMSFASSEGTGGLMNLDTLQALISIAGMDNVTSSDFLLMIKHFHSVDFSIIEGVTIEEYIDAIVDNPTSLEIYNEEIKSVLSGYGVSSNDVSDWTPDVFIDKVATLPDLINIVDFVGKDGKHLYEQSQADLSVTSHISDAALAQILQANLSKVSSYKNLSILDILILELTMIESPEFSGLEIFASVDISKLLEKEVGNSTFSGLILSMFPKNIFVEISVPFERNPDPNQVSSNIIINTSLETDADSAASSDAMIDTLSNIINTLGLSDTTFDKNFLLKKLDNEIYAILDSLNNNEVSEVPISIELTDKGAQLPTVYDLLIDFTAEPNTEPFTHDEMQATLCSFYNVDEFMDGTSYIDNVYNVNLYESSGFVERELNKKMFLNTAPYIDSADANKNVYNYLTTIGNNLSGTNIDTALNIPEFVNNTKHAKQGNLSISSLEFAKILLEGGLLSSIEESITIYKDFSIIDAMVASDGNMVLTIVGTLNDSSPPTDGKVCYAAYIYQGFNSTVVECWLY